MVDVKNEFLTHLNDPAVKEENNPWQSSRPSIPRDDSSHLPDHLGTRSTQKIIPPPPPPPNTNQHKPDPLQPPSSLDSHYAFERDHSESLQDDEMMHEMEADYDQILQKPRSVKKINIY